MHGYGFGQLSRILIAFILVQLTVISSCAHTQPCNPNLESESDAQAMSEKSRVIRGIRPNLGPRYSHSLQKRVLASTGESDMVSAVPTNPKKQPSLQGGGRKLAQPKVKKSPKWDLVVFLKPMKVRRASRFVGPYRGPSLLIYNEAGVLARELRFPASEMDGFQVDCWMQMDGKTIGGVCTRPDLGPKPYRKEFFFVDIETLEKTTLAMLPADESHVFVRHYGRTNVSPGELGAEDSFLISRLIKGSTNMASRFGWLRIGREGVLGELEFPLPFVSARDRRYFMWRGRPQLLQVDHSLGLDLIDLETGILRAIKRYRPLGAEGGIDIWADLPLYAFRRSWMSRSQDGIVYERQIGDKMMARVTFREGERVVGNQDAITWQFIPSAWKFRQRFTESWDGFEVKIRDSGVHKGEQVRYRVDLETSAGPRSVFLQYSRKSRSSARPGGFEAAPDGKTLVAMTKQGELLYWNTEPPEGQLAKYPLPLRRARSRFDHSLHIHSRILGIVPRK